MPVPLIAAGISAAPSIISAFKGGGGMSKEQKANMQAQTGLATEQTALGRLMRGQSEKTYGMSAPAYNQGLNYFRTLVGGGPGALRQLMSAENSLTNQAYMGAKMGLQRSGLRGGVGEQAAAQLTRDQAAKTAGFVPSMRYGAAEKLLQGGLSGLDASAGFGSGANAGFGNAGMTYASLGNTYDAQTARNERLWGALGQNLSTTLGPWLMNYQSGGGGSRGAAAGSMKSMAPYRGPMLGPQLTNYPGLPLPRGTFPQ